MPTTRPYVTAPERKRFRRAFLRLVDALGAVPETEYDPPPNTEWRLATTAGPLHIKLSQFDDRGYLPAVFCRFDDATAGSWFGASVPSGKWNFHFGRNDSADAALAYLESRFHVTLDPNRAPTAPAAPKRRRKPVPA